MKKFVNGFGTPIQKVEYLTKYSPPRDGPQRGPTPLPPGANPGYPAKQKSPLHTGKGIFHSNKQLLYFFCSDKNVISEANSSYDSALARPVGIIDVSISFREMTSDALMVYT